LRLLLDTHVLLWWRDNSPNLSSRAREAITDPTNEILISAATLWEIVIKRGLGKLRFPDDLEDVLREESFTLVPISFRHLRCLEALPLLHGDPFDRMLIAQSQAEGVPITTADRKFTPYGVATIW
jgi:PIN domain nuclease of toxin-antitoxin system